MVVEVFVFCDTFRQSPGRSDLQAVREECYLYCCAGIPDPMDEAVSEGFPDGLFWNLLHLFPLQAVDLLVLVMPADPSGTLLIDGKQRVPRKCLAALDFIERSPKLHAVDAREGVFIGEKGGGLIVLMFCIEESERFQYIHIRLFDIEFGF